MANKVGTVVASDNEGLQFETRLSTIYGCGSVGRAVASESRDPRVESSHRQDFLQGNYLLINVEKTKIKKKM